MKTIQFVGRLTIERELYVDAPMQVVASMFNKKVEELEAMSQMDLEELFMDNIYSIESSALLLRSKWIEYHDDYDNEELDTLIVNDTEEVV